MPCYDTHLLRIFPPFLPVFCVISSDGKVTETSVTTFNGKGALHDVNVISTLQKLLLHSIEIQNSNLPGITVHSVTL